MTNTDTIEFDANAAQTTAGRETRSGKLLDDTSHGNVLALDHDDPSYDVPLLLEYTGTESLHQPAGRAVLHTFEKVDEPSREFAIEDRDWEDQMDKQVTGSVSQVAEALGLSESEVMNRPDDVLVDYLIAEDADENLYRVRYEVGFPPLWHLERNEDEWDDTDGEIYGDIIVSKVARWSSAEDCPHL